MRIFLSWSGTTSNQVAQTLRDWLPAVIQAARPYFSPDDIAKGARWNTEVSKELEASRVGILCVTRDNLSAPWLMFEAGALAKNLDRSRVIPLLLNVEPADLSGPLSQFQAVCFDKIEVKRMVKVVNEELADNALESTVLDSVFEKWWPELEGKVQSILNDTRVAIVGPSRTDREVLEEVLELMREMSFRRIGSPGALSLPAVIDLLQYNSPIETLELSERALGCLKGAGVAYIGDVIQKSEIDLLRVPNFGRKSLNEIKEILASRALMLGMRLDGWNRPVISEPAK